MDKIKLEMEQIIAGALLLGFDRIYEADITLLVEYFLNKNSNYEFNLSNSKYKIINRYIKSKNGEIKLKDNLSLESYIPENESNLRKKLEQIAGELIRKYLENFDIEIFILRKIKHHIALSEGDIERLYCKKQQEEIKKIDDKKYVTGREDDLGVKIIELSNYGKLKLLKIDYVKEISIFTEELKFLGYDINMVDEFLLQQDLDLPIWNILSIENLEKFCNDFDSKVYKLVK